MYQVGDKVVYGIHGVCQIVDQEERIIDSKKINYLVLEPAARDGSKFLVPAHNAAAMAKLRKMLTREEMNALLSSAEVRDDAWIRDENQRKQSYRELIASGDRIGLMKMVHTLYRHKAVQTAAGKKCHLCDENFLRDAEKLLISEISVVMDMQQDQARQYIRNKLKEDV